MPQCPELNNFVLHEGGIRSLFNSALLSLLVHSPRRAWHWVPGPRPRTETEAAESSSGELFWTSLKCLRRHPEELKGMFSSEP